MGNKTDPYGIRLGISTNYRANWYTKLRNYANFFCKDYQARKYLERKLGRLNISSIQIDRLDNEVKIAAYLGKTFFFLKQLLNEIVFSLKKIMDMNVKFYPYSVKNQDLDAQLVSANIARQIEMRRPFRRVIQRAITSIMKVGVMGVKVIVSGRLNNAEIARREVIQEGSMSLQTLSIPIRYGFSIAKTKELLELERILCCVKKYRE